MFRAAIACALLICAVAVSGVAVADDPPAAAINAYKRGVEKGDKGDWDGAIADFTRAIEIDPRYAWAYSNRGFARSTKGDPDGAIADYTKAVEIDPRLATAYNNRGLAKSAKGDWDGAIADHTKAIEIDPRHKIAYLDRGLDKRHKGDLDGAIADYTKAIEIDPRSAWAYSKRGLAKSLKGDRDGAIADCTKAIEIDPRYADAYSNRGNVKWNSRDFEAATADLKKAIEIDAANDYARFLLFFSEAAGAEGMAKASENFKSRRAARARPMEKGSWVERVDRFLGGEVSAEELSKAADASPEKDRAGNRCESYFYSGMLAWFRGDRAAAEDLLHKCIATEKAPMIEYQAAKAVLSWPK